MAFDEIRLPEDVERGAVGGPLFKTTVHTLGSGFEVRNIDWSDARGEWDIGYGIQDRAANDAVISFFYARQGRGRGFRFKDWSDFEVITGNIGTGDGLNTDFQLRKQYVSGAVTYNRTITKPVAGTVRIFLDGIETFDFVVDTTTGVVTMGVAPGGGVVVTATFEFDVPVRFDTDKLDVNVEWFKAESIPQIPVIELRQ